MGELFTENEKNILLGFIRIAFDNDETHGKIICFKLKQEQKLNKIFRIVFSLYVFTFTLSFLYHSNNFYHLSPHR